MSWMGREFWNGVMGEFFMKTFDYGESIGIGCGIIIGEYETCHGECCYLKDSQICCFWCPDLGTCPVACLLISRMGKEVEEDGEI